MHAAVIVFATMFAADYTAASAVSVEQSVGVQSVVGKWRPLEHYEGKLRSYYIFRADGTGSSLLVEDDGSIAVDQPITWKQRGDRVEWTFKNGGSTSEFVVYDGGNRIKYPHAIGGVINHFQRY